jgi:N,N-dimethylformamidase
MAYADTHAISHQSTRERYERMGIVMPADYPWLPEDRYVVDQQLLSLYDRHSDDSGVCYSTRLRPILNIGPQYKQMGSDEKSPGPHVLGADLHLLDWMEVRGFQYDVATDEDLHREGADLLARYMVVVTGTHPEYWTEQMLDGLESYLTAGGRLMYLGGNGFYWVTSFDPERPHIIEIRRWGGTGPWKAQPGEYCHSTTGEIGGLWRARGRAPQRLTGVGFAAQGTGPAVPYRRSGDSFDASVAFIFEGVGEDETIGDSGLVMGGAGGYEVDRADAALGTPPHALVVATASGLSDEYQHCVEELYSTDPKQGGSLSPDVRGDMVYFRGPNGGGVFSVGSITWCGSLSHNDYDNAVSQITGNVLRRFSSEEPLP